MSALLFATVSHTCLSSKKNFSAVIRCNYCMPEGFPDYLDVAYEDGEGETPDDYPSIHDKIEKAIEVTKSGLEQYENPVVMWTGGKDSTLASVLRQGSRRELGRRSAARRLHRPLPALRRDASTSSNSGPTSGTSMSSVPATKTWVHYVDENGLEPGDDIHVAELSEHNQHHVRNLLEYEDETFPFLLDTYVGNHLLKTVALNDALEEYDVDGVISGVRWDEQEARADETFFSPRHDPDIYPPHDRVQPILQFDGSRRLAGVLELRRPGHRRGATLTTATSRRRRRPA